MKRWFWWAGLFGSFIFAQDIPVQEQLRVIFRDVRVHVTDRQGKPVRNLKLEDFRLKEKGREQEITFFEEVDLSPVRDEQGRESTIPKQRTSESNIVIIFDSSHMRSEAFPEFKRIIKKFIRDQSGEHTLMKVVQLEDRLIHLSPFLRNENLLLDAVDSAEYKGAQIRAIRAQESIVAKSFGDFLDPGYEPQEAALFRTDKLYELREAVRRKQQIKRNHFLAFESSLRHLGRVFDQMSGSKTVYLFTGGGFIQQNRGLVLSTQSESRKLGRIMNSANLTVYSFVHVPRKSVFEDFAQTGFTNLRDQPNPIRELGSSFMLASDTILENTNDLVQAPFEVSEKTGGVTHSLNRLSDIDRSFNVFNESVGHYYRLGYSLEAPKKTTTLEVTLRNPEKGWTMHYGKKFNPVKSYVDMDESDRAVAFEASLVYSQSFRQDLDVDWGFTGFKGLNRGETIPVYLELASKRFSKKGYDVGFAALNDVRDIIDYTRATVKHRGKGPKFLFYDVLLPRAKPRYLRFQIIDLATGDKSQFELPYSRKRINGDGFHISGMALALDSDATVLPVNHLRKEGKAPDEGLSLVAMRRSFDPFAIGDRLFIPAMEQVFNESEEFHLFFQLKNAKGAMGDYGIAYRLFHDGKALPCSLVMTETAEPQAGTFNCRGLLKTSKLPPGKYQLRIQLKRDRQNEIAVGNHSFEIRGGTVRSNGGR